MLGLTCVTSPGKREESMSEDERSADLPLDAVQHGGVIAGEYLAMDRKVIGWGVS